MSIEASGQSPLELFLAGEAELRNSAEAYGTARNYETAVETKLREAKTASESARQAANDNGVALLGRIHGSVTTDTDPGEYLQAVLNTYHSGQRVGDQVVESLAPMRAQIQEKPIPIAMIGSTVNKIVLGLSAGDVVVRRRNEHEDSFDTRSGIRLAIPLNRMSGYRGDSLFNRPWLYYDGDFPEAYPVGVVQSLSYLRIAGTLDEIREANDTPHRPFREHDTVMHHERDVKSTTGFVPVVAYGETAVSGLLSALYQSRNAESWGEPPNKDDVLAASISLDLPPEAVADIGIDELKDRFHALFLEHVTQSAYSAIYRESSRREFPNLGSSPIVWPITASPHVMRYAGVETEEVVDAVRLGVEHSFDKLRADNPLDRQSFWNDEKDHRLLEDEAREKATGVIAVRYGIKVEPALLQSEILERKFTERLEEKRKDFVRYEKRVRENPWLLNMDSRR